MSYLVLNVCFSLRHNNYAAFCVRVRRELGSTELSQSLVFVWKKNLNINF